MMSSGQTIAQTPVCSHLSASIVIGRGTTSRGAGADSSAGVASSSAVAEPMRNALGRGEDERLAPYALLSQDARRRYPIDDEGRAFDYRTAYQRDRDRVVYSRAFR